MDSWQVRGERLRRQRRRDPAQRRVAAAGRRLDDALDPGLVDAGGGERLGVAPRLVDAEVLEAARAARPRRRRRRARRPPSARPSPSIASRWRPTSTAASLALDARRRRSDATAPVTTCIASSSCAAARRAAAAGLLSSCARPAAICPSAASRSRSFSIAVDEVRRRAAPRRITRRCTAGCSKREPPEVLRLECSAMPAVASRCAAARGASSPVRRRDRSHPGRRLLPVRRAPRSRRGPRASGRRPRAAAADPAASTSLLGDDLAPAATSRTVGDRRPLAERRRRRARRRDRSGAGRRRSTVRHPSTRYWWTSDTAIEPSPDGGRDPLDRPRAHVAGHEDAGHARLEQVGIARQRPARVLRRRGRRG